MVSIHNFFVLRNRAANIPTVIVPGFVKAGKYEPGDLIGDGAYDTWCAVHVDGSWQVIHPVWVCLGTYGPERHGKVQIEDDPFIAAKDEQYTKKNNSDKKLNDEFFMPRPDVYIYKCYAKDEQWRLITQDRNLRSLDEFMRLGYFSSTFFKLGLTLLSQPFCVQTSINDVVHIVILAPSMYSHKLNMDFKLEYDTSNQEQNGQQQFKPSKQQALLLHKKVLRRLVVNYRSNDRFIFEVRLPVPGSYKFDIMGGFGSELSNLCRFKLITNDLMGEWFINACDPRRGCWGPGPSAEDVGLLLPSKPSGLLSIQPQSHSGVLRDRSVYHHLTTIQFTISKALYRKYEFSADVIPSILINKSNIEPHISSSGEIKADIELQKARSKGDEVDNEAYPVRVQCSTDHASRQITFQIIGRMDGGECTVVVKATEMEIKNSMRMSIKNSTKSVCFYLLTANNVFYREVRIRLIVKLDI